MKQIIIFMFGFAIVYTNIYYGQKQYFAQILRASNDQNNFETDANNFKINKFNRNDEAKNVIYFQDMLTTKKNYNGKISQITQDPFGNVYIAGYFDIIENFKASNIVAYNLYTNKFESLGDGLNDWVFAIHYYDNYLYAGGWFTASGKKLMYNIARWDIRNKKWESLGDVFLSSEFPLINSIISYKNKLIVAGKFEKIGNMNAQNIVVYDFDEKKWSPLFKKDSLFGKNSLVNKIQIYGKYLIIAGSFEKLGDNYVNSLAMYDLEKEKFQHINNAIYEKKIGEVKDFVIKGKYLYAIGRLVNENSKRFNFISADLHNKNIEYYELKINDRNLNFENIFNFENKIFITTINKTSTSENKNKNLYLFDESNKAIREFEKDKYISLISE